ncbi:phosphoribosylaminoimidazolesuccinocarboxamide synthase [Thermoflexus sp.]|uniref:phosphoribosylaminoimidazolesuccinocarboxamide synthase n=1 Tax=Thermoflexus sp. TaxID=1969742 RepID=UPI0035E43576
MGLSESELRAAIPHALRAAELSGLGPKREGKVRDIYIYKDLLFLVATDRISAFDRVLGVIPFKGQVLTQLSAWWFERTRDIVPNHLIAVPDPNVMVVRRAEPLPVEVIVRGYITGVTRTSLWTLYAQGERRPYGIPLPDGLQKNDPLPCPILTPTTKAPSGAHDEVLTREEILRRGLVPGELWERIEAIALALFARGQELARQAGLILVDTKYEFGMSDGELVLIDELHTPDSSRFWLAETYRRGHEPESYDKEYVRLWFAARGYRGDGAPPEMPPELIIGAAARYIAVYERLTGQPFIPGEQPGAERIARNVHHFLEQDLAAIAGRVRG